MQNETKSKLQLVSGKIIVTEKVRLIIRHKKKKQTQKYNKCFRFIVNG